MAKNLQQHCDSSRYYTFFREYWLSLNSVAGVVGSLAETSAKEIARFRWLRGESSELISLKSSIESACAGELRRGFRVVAEEVERYHARLKSTVLDVAKMLDGFNDGMLE